MSIGPSSEAVQEMLEDPGAEISSLFQQLAAERPKQADKLGELGELYLEKGVLFVSDFIEMTLEQHRELLAADASWLSALQKLLAIKFTEGLRPGVPAKARKGGVRQMQFQSPGSNGKPTGNKTLGVILEKQGRLHEIYDFLSQRAVYEPVFQKQPRVLNGQRLLTKPFEALTTLTVRATFAKWGLLNVDVLFLDEVRRAWRGLRFKASNRDVNRSGEIVRLPPRDPVAVLAQKFCYSRRRKASVRFPPLEPL